MKVLISTGGSGGHIFPALQTGLELKRRGHDVIFAGALAMSLDKIRSLGFEANVIDTQGLTDKSPIGLMRFTSKTLSALVQASRGIDQIKPDKVIGFGGYGSFPIIMAACLKRYPTMIHEQNVIPGKANKILAKCVKRVAVAFKQSMPVFGAKSIWTGCPCNNQALTTSTKDIRTRLGLKPDSKVVVLLGGSQGSKFLNEAFFEAMKTLLKEGNIEAVHVTGKNECTVYQEKYKAEHLPAVVSSFISPIEDIYAIADVIVSRSGAATVSELGFYGTPSILVPYPFAHGHQEYNAHVLVQAGSAVLIKQKDLTHKDLLNAMRAYLNVPVSKDDFRRKNAPYFVSDSVVKLADALEAL